AGLARHVGVALVGRHAEVTGRAGVLLTDQVAVDLDTAALDVEELERVGAELVVQVGGDVEGVAGLAVGDEGVAGAGGGVRGEVHRVHVLPGGRVHTARLGPPGGHHVTGRVLELPGQ